MAGGGVTGPYSARIHPEHASHVPRGPSGRQERRQERAFPFTDTILCPGVVGFRYLGTHLLR